jgi:heat-inducible transcriptional repressor
MLGLKWSPSTIRNMMADLEEAQLLYQPHTSAGRIPTVQALQYFLKEEADPILPSKEEQKELTSLVQKEKDLLSILILVSRWLSEHTDGIVVALPPDVDSLLLGKAELVPIEKNSLLLLWVTPTGGVFHRVVTFPFPLDRSLIQTLNQILNEQYQGLTLKEIRERLKQDLKDLARAAQERIFRILAHLSQKEEKVVLEGTERIVTHPIFGDLHSLRQILEALERREILIQILKEAEKKGFQVLLGEEIGVKTEKPISFFLSSLGKEGIGGSIGIIAPLTSSYPYLLGHLSFATRVLNQTLGYGE